MTKIIINHLLNFKNKLFISIYFILVLLVFIIPLPFDSNSYEIILDLNFYKSNYNEVIIELLKLLTAISVLILAIDHNQGYINNITTFKERIKVIVNKLFIYCYLVFINVILIILMYFFILNVFDYYILIDKTFIIRLLFLGVDNLILLLLILLIVRSNNKLFAYLIVAYYYILNLFYVSSSNMILFYITPFYSYNYQNYSNTNLYIIFYIILLIVLNIFKYEHEDFLDK